MTTEKNLDFLKGLLRDELRMPLVELSKDEIILQKVIEKSTNIQEYVNSVTAAIVCILSREKELANKFNKLIQSNPEIEKILKTGVVK